MPHQKYNSVENNPYELTEIRFLVFTLNTR